MTEKDKALIERANEIRPFDYRDVDYLIVEADTKEARERLENIRCELYFMMQDTL